MVPIDVRKLISFGKGSFIISMPKDWVQKNHLKKGDLISVDDGGFELTLSASHNEKKAEAKEITISTKSKELMLIKTEIVSSYLNGFDSINIQFDANHKDILKVKDIIRNLSGLEIMEQTSTRLVAKNLINIREISIGNIIRRMDIITRSMMEDAILCYRGQCTHDAIEHRDADVNRLYYLAHRVIKNAMKSPGIAKSLGIGQWNLHCNSIMIFKLERIADNQKRISRYLCNAELDRETLADLDKIHTDISLAYNNAMKCYHNKEADNALKLEMANHNITIECDKLLKKFMARGKSSVPNLVAVAKIVENMKSTAVEIRNIARNIISYDWIP